MPRIGRNACKAHALGIGDVLASGETIVELHKMPLENKIHFRLYKEGRKNPYRDVLYGKNSTIFMKRD